jgi:hypothetical protein
MNDKELERAYEDMRKAAEKLHRTASEHPSPAVKHEMAPGVLKILDELARLYHAPR